MTHEDLFDQPSPVRTLNPSAPRDIPYAHVACIGCKQVCDVPISASARLCAVCRQDPDAVIARLQGEIDRHNLELAAAIDTFGVVWGNASEQDQARFERVLLARLQFIGTAQASALAQKERQARARKDGLSVLLEADLIKEEIALRLSLEIGLSYCMIEEIMEYERAML